MPSESLKIITNGYVLTCDPENRGGRYTLLVRNGRIAEISESPDFFASLYPYATVVDATGKLIVPGFVNAHVHSESILLRERTEGLHFSLWPHDIRLQESSRKLIERSSHDDIRSIYLAAYFGHLKSGTTCVGEFGPSVDGDGLLRMLEAIERTDVTSIVTLQNWSQIAQAMANDSQGGRFNVSLGRANDFTVYTFESLLRASKELKAAPLVHIAEQREEVEEVRRNFQKGILSVLQGFGALQQGTMLVHLNYLSSSEIDILNELSLTATICARSAALKRTGYPSLRYLASNNVRLCIGTDWASLDMVQEMRFLHELPLLIPGVRQFSGMELLRMATINGAHALGVSSEVGSIESGKKADLTFFDITDLRLPQPKIHANAEWLADLLVNHLSMSHISDVMINGEFYVTRGQIMTMSEEDILGGFLKTREVFFPDAFGKPAQTTAQRLVQDHESRPRLIPFVSDGRSYHKETEGFEEGYPVSDGAITSMQGTSPTAEETPLPLKSTQPSPLSARPELSKNVKRVFGEDEEF
jgi:5-methylthioadenosine/S-adenosylhomocysteine deaminase